MTGGETPPLRVRHLQDYRKIDNSLFNIAYSYPYPIVFSKTLKDYTTIFREMQRKI